jgi:gliding motility-associated-like protein
MTYSADGSTYTNTTGVFALLTPGNYTVTAKSSAGCISAGTIVTINAQPVTPSVPALGAITQPDCSVGSGSLILNGLPTGNWTINPGAISGSTPGTTITGLIAGTYNYTVTNAAGCTSVATANAVINPVPQAPSAPTVSIVDPTCATATGTITVTSATAGLMFSLDGATYSPYPAGGYTTVFAGPHTLIAQNALNCVSAATNMTLFAPQSIKNSYTKEISNYNGFNVSCHGLSNGSIKIIPEASAQLTFSWSGPGGFTASTQEISGLIAGQYTLTITDKKMCTENEIFDLTEPGQLAVTFDPSLSTAGGFNINCAGSKTGSVTATAQNNAGVVNYIWQDGFSGNSRTNLSAGIYKLIITDANGCSTSSSITLTEPDAPLKLAFEVTPAFCPTKPDGQIILTVTGGVPGNDYIYKWSNNSTIGNLLNILPGTYSLTVSDLNGCSVQDTVEVKATNDICLVIPEAFSPNGDLVNDTWIISNIDLYPEAVITIYNRWGQTLWRSERGYPNPWDGKSRGVEVPLDSYHYAIDLHNGSKLFVGTITIVK